WDIKSSQPQVLKQLLDEAGIDSSWITEYLAADKKEYADRAGVDVKSWKKCLCGLLMGASLPDPVRACKSAEILAEFKKASKTDANYDKLEKAARRVGSIVREVREAHG